MILHCLMDAIMRESSFAQYIMKQGSDCGEREAIADIIEVLEIRFDLPETDPLSCSHSGRRFVPEAVASLGGSGVQPRGI